MSNIEEARTATHFKVYIQNAISQRPDSWFSAEFDDFDLAMKFADDNKWYYNNTRVTLDYLSGYETRERFVPKVPNLWTSSGEWVKEEVSIYKSVRV